MERKCWLCWQVHINIYNLFLKFDSNPKHANIYITIKKNFCIQARIQEIRSGGYEIFRNKTFTKKEQTLEKVKCKILYIARKKNFRGMFSHHCILSIFNLFCSFKNIFWRTVLPFSAVLTVIFVHFLAVFAVIFVPFWADFTVLLFLLCWILDI